VVAVLTPGETPTLRTTLGFWQVTATSVGIVIGAGIYVLVGGAAKDAGNGDQHAWILGGCAMLAGGVAWLAMRRGAALNRK
jgi:amino acid transporter